MLMLSLFHFVFTQKMDFQEQVMVQPEIVMSVILVTEFMRTNLVVPAGEMVMV